jgi:hypothetical protein
MNPTVSISKQQIAEDFSAAADGKLAKDRIDAAVDALSAADTIYSAHGSVASLIFYLKFQVTLPGGKTFDGNAGGLSSPGGGALFGDVYTDDLQVLYSNTVSFEFQSTPVYLSILFFDANSNLLGHFQCGAVSTVAGVGGGKGSWS